MNYNIFVFAKLKPSQVKYKIIPLSQANNVNNIYVLRKTNIDIDNKNITCIALPKLLRVPPFYWALTGLYGSILARKHNCNLILSYNTFPHGFNGMLASYITKLPFIYAEIIEDTIHFYNNFFKRLLIKPVLKRANAILVPGNTTKKYWLTKGFKKIIQLHSTIDTNEFVPKKNEAKHYDFIFIGVYDKRKRPDVIIKAFAQLTRTNNNIRMCMIGYGNMKDALLLQISKLNLNSNIDLIETNDVLTYIQQSKILVMASLAEGIPCAMLEAMACELIVVVPSVGDISDVVVHTKNGFLHDNSYTDILKQMSLAFNKYPMLQNVRQNARDTIKNEHSYLVAKQRWEKLLTSI